MFNPETFMEGLPLPYRIQVQYRDPHTEENVWEFCLDTEKLSEEQLNSIFCYDGPIICVVTGVSIPYRVLLYHDANEETSTPYIDVWGNTLEEAIAKVPIRPRKIFEGGSSLSS